jgi:hypothetical protein
MKTPLTELIERLEKKIEACNSNNLEREAMGMIEAKAIATELLEKEREQIVNSYHMGQIGVIEVLAQAFPVPAPNLDNKEDAKQYYNETYKQNK